MSRVYLFKQSFSNTKVSLFLKTSISVLGLTPSLLFADEFMKDIPATNTAGCISAIFSDEAKAIPNPYKFTYHAHKSVEDKQDSEWARSEEDFLNPEHGIYYNQQYILHFNYATGLLMTSSNEVFNTQNNGDDFDLVVVSQNGEIYTRHEIKQGEPGVNLLLEKRFPDNGHFGHPSFGLANVKFAGEWKVKDGVIMEMNNKTGHYSKCTAALFAPTPVDLNILHFAESYCQTPNNHTRVFDVFKKYAQSEDPRNFFERKDVTLVKTELQKTTINCSEFFGIDPS